MAVDEVVRLHQLGFVAVWPLLGLASGSSWSAGRVAAMLLVSLCFNAFGVVVGSEDTTDAQCAARGGKKVLLVDTWMLHDWVVPGFECSWGVFAPECPELGGRVGGTAWDPPAPGQQLGG